MAAEVDVEVIVVVLVEAEAAVVAVVGEMTPGTEVETEATTGDVPAAHLDHVTASPDLHP